LVEYTFVTTVLLRPNTSGAPDKVGERDAGWRDDHEWVADQLSTIIAAALTRPGAVGVADSHVIVEEMGAQYRELRLHSGTEHCEHTD
jgi:hypothetical protein